jgi:hypothetical protein
MYPKKKQPTEKKEKKKKNKKRKMKIIDKEKDGPAKTASGKEIVSEETI